MNINWIPTQPYYEWIQILNFLYKVEESLPIKPTSIHNFYINSILELK